jgi:hypothetical protein
VIARAEGTSKKDAQQKASLDFLRKIFPPDFTYKMVLKFIKKYKKPLDELKKRSENLQL